jgi:phenylalanyl-tRNA synthetase beta chain
MRVPLSWLRELVEVELPVAELAHRLTMSGTEVEAIETIGAEWERVYVGAVLDLQRHPRAESLWLAEVESGHGRVTVVTGAPNLFVGARVPVVLPGGRLPGGVTVERRTFRGVVSEGMVCAGDELGISPDHAGIYLLEPDAPVGTPLAEYLGDTVLDLNVTPNRPDNLSVLGIAREVAALTGARLRKPPKVWPTGPRPAGEYVSVEIADPDLCPRYVAAVVAGVTIGPSPGWMQRRLYYAGMRPIANVVDVTNYVMLELGQPLHAFDADRLRGGIVVRRASPGERLTTLDGVERTLEADQLVIADRAGAVAVAGVIGGADSEVHAGTRTVVIEAANFKPQSVRRTARALGLKTEAARRFERGVDPTLPEWGACRAVELIVATAGGQSAAGLVDAYPAPERPRVIELTEEAVAGLLGKRFPANEMARILEALEFGVARADGRLLVTVPSFRRDVEHRADLAEEVARIVGYDSIPYTRPAGRLPEPIPNVVRARADLAKETLVACGLQEVITFSLVDPTTPSRLNSRAAVAPAGPDEQLRVVNPIAPELSALRTTLLASLLDVVRANLRYRDRVAVFELARVYLPPLDPLPTEAHRLAIALTGPRHEVGWNQPAEPVDFFDLKGIVEALLAALRVAARFAPTDHPTYHPGRAAEVQARAGDRTVSLGVLGQIHPLVAERFDLAGREVYAAELDFETLARLSPAALQAGAPPRYPGVTMDVAVVLDEAVPHERVEAVIRSAGAPLLSEVRLFDVYRGTPIPPGKKSLAYSLTFRSPERTLTDAEAAAAHARVEEALRAELGAQIRGRA